MTAAAKILGRMRNNPMGWRTGNREQVTLLSDIPREQKLTVPARRPIKPVYVKKFLEFIDEVAHKKD